MNYIGIDLHKRIIVVCVLNGKSEVIQRAKFQNDQTEEMQEFFTLHQPFQAVFEATAAYDWFYELLDPLAERVVLAHPKKMRIIAESSNKSDKVDAYVLAEFLSFGKIPESHCPSPYIKGYRDLMRFRGKIQSRITSVKNRIRNVLARYNMDRKSLFTIEGKKWLRTVPLKETARYQIDCLLDELEFHRTKLKETMEKIHDYTQRAPHRIAEARALLLTIPGVGEITADVVVSELGDMERFSSQKKVCKYAGLEPKRRQSADRVKMLPISKNGSKWLRWAMVEAAWRVVQYSRKWKRIYESLCKQTGSKKKAIVALARRLLCVMFSMIRNGSAYSATA